jgi:hypothetical protein
MKKINRPDVPQAFRAEIYPLTVLRSSISPKQELIPIVESTLVSMNEV